MKKRILSIVLIVLVLALALPITAFAADTDVASWADLQTAISEASDGDTITLSQDIVASGTDSALTINGGNFRIDLNGHTIDRNLASPTENGYVISVTGTSNVTIIDYSDTTGTITGGNNSGNGGAISVEGSNAKLTLRSLTVNENKSAGNGGGIYVNGASLDMVDVSVDSNTAVNGGGIAIISGSSKIYLCQGITNNEATLGGGIYSDASTIEVGYTTTINGNTASTAGGAVYNKSGSITLGTYEINDNHAGNSGGAIYTNDFVALSGKVSGCTAQNGGAVYVTPNGRLESNGAAIENCTATKDGGAVYVENYTENGLKGVATFINNSRISKCTADGLGGAIYTNGVVGLESVGITECASTKDTGIYLTANGSLFTGDTAKADVYIADGGLLSIGTGSDVKVPSKSMKIGISMEKPGVFTKNEGTDYIGNFASNVDKYDIFLTSDNKLQLNKQFTVTFDSDGGSSVDEQKVINGEKATKPENPTKEGYTFVTWVDANSKVFDFSKPITDNITLTAKWNKIPDPEPINYDIIKNANSTWELKEGVAPTFSSDADFSKFVRVELDGKVLDPANYTVESGSTVVTLKPEYAATLAPGKHTITIVSNDGSATTEFTLAAPAAEEIANTGDANQVSGLTLACGACIGLAVTLKKKDR